MMVGRFSNFIDNYLLESIIGVLILVTTGLIILAAATYDPEKDPCIQAGGHWLTRTNTGVGVTSGGNVTIVPSTIRFCISEDGRIIE